MKYIVLVLNESFDEYTKVVDIETFDKKELATVSYKLHVTKYTESFSEVYEDYEVFDTPDGKAISNSDGTEICHVKLLESDYYEMPNEVPQWMKPKVKHS